MKTPSFLIQAAVRDLQPLLVTEIDAGRLLAVPRATIKELAAEGMLDVLQIDGVGRRITVGSLTNYVTRLATQCKP